MSSSPTKPPKPAPTATIMPLSFEETPPGGRVDGDGGGEGDTVEEGIIGDDGELVGVTMEEVEVIDVDMGGPGGDKSVMVDTEKSYLL